MTASKIFKETSAALDERAAMLMPIETAEGGGYLVRFGEHTVAIAGTRDEAEALARPCRKRLADEFAAVVLVERDRALAVVHAEIARRLASRPGGYWTELESRVGNGIQSGDEPVPASTGDALVAVLRLLRPLPPSERVLVLFMAQAQAVLTDAAGNA